MRTAPSWELLVAADFTLEATAQGIAGNRHVEYAEPAKTTRSYLDSADYLLHRAGLSLEHDQAQQVFTLREQQSQQILSIASGAPGSDAWRPQIPAGVLREKVFRVLGERAPVVQLKMKLQTSSASLRDENGKTRTRLHLEHRVDSPGPGRLRIEPLRGFESDAQRVRKRLKKLGAKTSRENWLEANNAPKMAQAVWKPCALDPGDSVPRALAEVLDGSFKLMLYNVEGLQRDIDTEFLHDFRIAARRTRSVLADIKEGIPKDDRRVWRRVLKSVNAHTGHLRDLDVALVHLDDLRPQLDAADEAALASFRAHIEQSRYEEHANLCTWLADEAFSGLPERWKQFIHRLHAQAAASDATIGKLAKRSVRALHEQFSAQAREIDEHSPLASLHELRKTGKHLRYMIEAFASLSEESERRGVLKTLKRTQDQLGEICDRDVQASSFRTYADNCRARGEARQAQLLDKLADARETPQSDRNKRMLDQLHQLGDKALRKRIRNLIRT